MDFMQDRLHDGRRFRTFNVIDESNREGLTIEISPSLPSVRVIAILGELIAQHGTPARIRCDNGTEFRSLAFTRWAEEKNIEILYIQPGKPVQNAFMERFNRSFRTEVLDCHRLQPISTRSEVPSLGAFALPADVKWPPARVLWACGSHTFSCRAVGNSS
jgi:putative transposase